MFGKSVCWLLGLFLLLFSTGCNVLGNTYRVVIDENLPDSVQSDMVEAVEEWETALGPNLNIIAINVGKCGNRVERQICVHAASTADLQALGDWNPNEDAVTQRHNGGFSGPDDGAVDSADIYFDVDRNADFPHDFIVMVLAHEMGHAMGLEHVQDVEGNNLMYWETNGQSQRPSCNDIAQWLVIRHYPDLKDYGRCPEGGSFQYFHN